MQQTIMLRVITAVLHAAIWLSASSAIVPVLAQPASVELKNSEFDEAYQRLQKSQDVEERIALGEQVLALEAALQSWTLSIPRDHVKTDLRFVLGIAYVQRTQGVRADNLEKAIEHFQGVLSFVSREAQPELWGQAQNNLAIASWNRIRGERSDNEEQAIAHFEAALSVFTREARPDAWAEAQNNLAVVYLSRLRGERADNLESAIAHFQAALTVFSRERMPLRWAQAQNNLGAAFRSRIRGDQSGNREQAIERLESALTVFARADYPRPWAEARNNLAIAYLDRIEGERADNIEQAISQFEAALTVFSREGFPQAFAQAHSNLGIAYADRLRGERSDNRQRAIAAYADALAVFTLEAFPRDHLRTQRLLGGAYSEAGDWSKAGTAYGAARDAFLLLFGQGLSEVEARDLINQAGPVFAEGAFAAIKRGELSTAIQLASEGRARLMAVSLKLQTLPLAPDQRRRLDELRAAIRTEERAEETTQGAERATALAKLIAHRQELLALVKSASAPERQGGSAISAVDTLAAGGGAVAVPVLTRFGARLLIAAGAPNTSLGVVDLPELTSQQLDRLMLGERSKEGEIGGWLGAYNINYLAGDDFEQRWPEWLSAIGDLGPELWRLIGARLVTALDERGVASGARLVWLPSGALGILPLGLVQDPVSKRRLADTYEIVYALSLEALAAAQHAIGNSSGATLAAVVNPTGDLAGTEKEGEIVASYFGGDARTIVQRDAATPDAVLAALKGKAYWHFATHGTFAWNDARRSALVMHDRALLTVGRLLDTSGLGQPRLVVLSACETGLYDIGRNPDEFIGLPGAFTALGAAGVLGTLWPVSDDATALLIAKFYELHIGDNLSPPTALSRAQAWMRQATNEELDNYAKSAATQGRLDRRHLAEIEHALSTESLRRSRNSALVEWISRDNKPPAGKSRSVNPKPLARPFAHPYFWAGFVYTGL